MTLYLLSFDNILCVNVVNEFFAIIPVKNRLPSLAWVGIYTSEYWNSDIGFIKREQERPVGYKMVVVRCVVIKAQDI